MARRMLGTKKPKKVSYRFIEPDSDVGQPMYVLLADLVEAHHRELQKVGTRIALAWNVSWGPDVDGRVTLGKCRKVSDLEREIADLQAYDFVIVLLQSFWNDLRVTELQRRALLDHELCHAAVLLDKHGDPVIDECGRTAFRTRKHDLEEFACIADRYGCWKGDLVAFNDALERAKQRAAQHWIGYSALQTELTRAGLSIPITEICTWSEDERREAATWALLRNDLPSRFQQDIVPPLFVVKAAQSETRA